MEGWTIHLADSLLQSDLEATKAAMILIREQLQRVTEVIPQQALKQLQAIPIWISPPYKGFSEKAEYHPSRKWLEENGREPKMARAVEVTNVKKFFFENRRMPYLLLHELAHGYHDRYLQGGYGNAEIRKLFENATASGTYDKVDRFNGEKIVKDKAYALSNPMEYFAESTEAYFGKNDFFPFNRKELKEADPEMHDLIEKLWNVPITNK